MPRLESRELPSVMVWRPKWACSPRRDLQLLHRILTQPRAEAGNIAEGESDGDGLDTAAPWAERSILVGWSHFQPIQIRRPSAGGTWLKDWPTKKFPPKR